MNNTLATLIGTALLVSSAALADEPLPQETETFTKWGEADTWMLYVDSDRESCLMQKTFEGEHVIQIGKSDAGTAYIGAFARIPDEFIGREQTQEVTLIVGTDAKIAEGIKRGQRDETTLYTGAYLEAPSTQYYVQNPKAVQEFYYEGETYRIDYELDGIEAATAKLAECDRQFGS